MIFSCQLVNPLVQFEFEYLYFLETSNNDLIVSMMFPVQQLR